MGSDRLRSRLYMAHVESTIAVERGWDANEGTVYIIKDIEPGGRRESALVNRHCNISMCHVRYRALTTVDHLDAFTIHVKPCYSEASLGELDSQRQPRIPQAEHCNMGTTRAKTLI